jgi:radical SAM-linked protein
MRIRITFTKTGGLIYIGNLDLYTMWERAARRAGLPLSYSQGFHPQPKIHFAAPLPLGYSSRCEVLDMRLNEALECDALCDRLNAALPAEIRVLQVQEIDDKAPAVQTQVLSADYEVTLRGPVDEEELTRQVDWMLGAESLPRQRRERSYDLRPLVEHLAWHRSVQPDGAILEMRLKAQEGATGRPDEVLLALGIGRDHARIERTALHFKRELVPPASTAG